MTKHNRSLLCCRSAVCPHPSLSRAQILFSSCSRAPVGVLRHVHCKLVWGEGWYGVGIDTEDHSYTVSAQHDKLAPKRLIHLLDLWKSIWAVFFTPQSVADVVISLWKVPRFTSGVCVTCCRGHTALAASVCLPRTYDAFHCLHFSPRAPVVLKSCFMVLFMKRSR